MTEQLDNTAEKVRGIHLAEIFPVMSEVFENNGSFLLTITGTSMYPTILGNRDRVLLVRAPDQLKKYDLPLYRRDNGAFVLHRIVRVEKDGTYTCCGDHQWLKERGLRQDQMIAVVQELERKGKRFSADNPQYRAWVRLWTFLFPMRHLLFWLQAQLKKVIRPFRKTTPKEG